VAQAPRVGTWIATFRHKCFTKRVDASANVARPQTENRIQLPNSYTGGDASQSSAAVHGRVKTACWAQYNSQM
jgi:hypothetical protein